MDRIGLMQGTSFVVRCIRKRLNCQKGTMLNTDIELNIVNIKKRDCLLLQKGFHFSLLVGMLVNKNEKNPCFYFYI